MYLPLYWFKVRRTPLLRQFQGFSFRKVHFLSAFEGFQSDCAAAFEGASVRAPAANALRGSTPSIALGISEVEVWTAGRG